jgi:hypothetical protein
MSYSSSPTTFLEIRPLTVLAILSWISVVFSDRRKAGISRFSSFREKFTTFSRSGEAGAASGMDSSRLSAFPNPRGNHRDLHAALEPRIDDGTEDDVRVLVGGFLDDHIIAFIIEQLCHQVCFILPAFRRKVREGEAESIAALVEEMAARKPPGQ